MPASPAKTGRVLPALPVFLLALAGCGQGGTAVPPIIAAPAAAAASSDQAAIATFLDRHWARPLAAQGRVPDGFSAVEASLAPADCGSCHVEQYRDWQTALHARAMGPGLMGQLVEMDPAAREQHQECIRCHAPLAEQADALVAEIAAAKPASPGKTGLPSSLHAQGVVCAACHVRSQQRSGPPRRDRSAPDAMQQALLPHAGFVTTTAFEDSRFCSACHQFQPDEYALNGKLLENTYEEWKSSRHAREGRSCQSCHMPERRHLWRGIHDPEMVRSGVDFAIENGDLRGAVVHAVLHVRNSGTGHYFPTYVTPRLIAEIEQLASDGLAVPGTRVEHVIQRQVPLDLGSEIADTRLPPDGELRLLYERPRHRAAVALVYRLRAEPDEFYARFYRALLADDSIAKGRRLLRTALEQAESSAFVVYEERRELPEP